jgi:hypothetical protein
MGWACSMNGKCEKCVRNLGRKTCREEITLKDLVEDGKIRLEWTVGKEGGNVHWIHLAQGRDQWKSLVNTVVNLRVP